MEPHSLLMIKIMMMMMMMMMIMVDHVYHSYSDIPR